MESGTSSVHERCGERAHQLRHDQRAVHQLLGPRRAVVERAPFRDDGALQRGAAVECRRVGVRARVGPPRRAVVASVPVEVPRKRAVPRGRRLGERRPLVTVTSSHRDVTGREASIEGAAEHLGVLGRGLAQSGVQGVRDRRVLCCAAPKHAQTVGLVADFNGRQRAAPPRRRGGGDGRKHGLDFGSVAGERVPRRVRRVPARLVGAVGVLERSRDEAGVGHAGPRGEVLWDQAR